MTIRVSFLCKIFFSVENLVSMRLSYFFAMQKMETPKGNEMNSKMKGSREKIALSKKLINGELISFSDLIFNPKR
jgi:hypothetical protein